MARSIGAAIRSRRFACPHCFHSLSTKIAPRPTTTSPAATRWNLDPAVLLEAELTLRRSKSGLALHPYGCQIAFADHGIDRHGGVSPSLPTEILKVANISAFSDAVRIGNFGADHDPAGRGSDDGADRDHAGTEGAIRQREHLDLEFLPDLD